MKCLYCNEVRKQGNTDRYWSDRHQNCKDTFCPACHLRFEKSEKHDCTHQPVQCTQCLLYVPQLYMEEHLKNFCAESLIRICECPNFVVKRKEKDQIGHNCKDYRVKLLEQQVQTLVLQVQALETRLKDCKL